MNSTWTKFLNGIINIPGAKVDRDSFLRKTFKRLSGEELEICVEDYPLAVLSMTEVDKAAYSVINSHALKVAAISAASGIPGGFALLATIPADLANYYYHVVMVGQKLGYLYGFPDMVDSNGNLTESGRIMLTAFIGVMNKVGMANDLIRNVVVELTHRISEETATRIAGKILSMQAVAQSVEFIAHKLGTQITARTASKGITKAIPIVSGLICGGLTYTAFKLQAKRLHKALKENVPVAQAI